jgi:excisionase family DNA binding protein
MGAVMNITTDCTKADIATPAELASDFKTTKPTVLSWFHQGRIPAVVSIGRVIRFSRAEVAKALASRNDRKGDAA